MCRSAADGGRRCPGGKRGGATGGDTGGDGHEIHVGQAINNPDGPVHTGSGDQYNADGAAGRPVHLGTGRQFFGDEAVQALAGSTSSREKAERRAARAAERAERHARRARDRAGRDSGSTVIIGGTGPVHIGDVAQFNRRRQDGAWETYTPGS